MELKAVAGKRWKTFTSGEKTLNLLTLIILTVQNVMDIGLLLDFLNLKLYIPLLLLPFPSIK